MERLTTTPALLKSNKIKGLSNYAKKHHEQDKEISLLTILENYGMKCFFSCFKAAQQDRIDVKKAALKLAMRFSARVLPMRSGEIVHEPTIMDCLDRAKNWLETPSETAFEIREGAKTNTISEAAADVARLATYSSVNKIYASPAAIMSIAWCGWTASSASEIVNNNNALSIDLTAMAAHSTALWASKALENAEQDEKQKQIEIIQNFLTKGENTCWF